MAVAACILIRAHRNGEILERIETNTRPLQDYAYPQRSACAPEHAQRSAYVPVHKTDIYSLLVGRP